MDTWQEIVSDSPRQYAICCKNLANDKVISHQADEIVETASIIKLPIMLCLLDKVQRRELSLQQPITVLKRHIGEDGSGQLQYFDLSQPILLYNLLWLMIAISDNVATNVIIELLGQETINYYIHGLEARQTTLLTHLLSFPKEFIPNKDRIATTTAYETANLLEALIVGKLLNETYTKLALQTMRATSSDIFCRRLPFQKLQSWGNKTGRIAIIGNSTAVLNDCGYIIDKQDTKYIFSMFVSGPSDEDFTSGMDSIVRTEFAEVARRLFAELSHSS